MTGETGLEPDSPAENSGIVGSAGGWVNRLALRGEPVVAIQKVRAQALDSRRTVFNFNLVRIRQIRKTEVRKFAAKVAVQ